MAAFKNVDNTFGTNHSTRKTQSKNFLIFYVLHKIGIFKDAAEQLPHIAIKKKDVCLPDISYLHLAQSAVLDTVMEIELVIIKRGHFQIRAGLKVCDDLIIQNRVIRADPCIKFLLDAILFCTKFLKRVRINTPTLPCQIKIAIPIPSFLDAFAGKQLPVFIISSHVAPPLLRRSTVMMIIAS